MEQVAVIGGAHLIDLAAFGVAGAGEFAVDDVDVVEDVGSEGVGEGARAGPPYLAAAVSMVKRAMYWGLPLWKS